ncbi:hypothetical protein [Mesorhizobium sp. M0207]|uniref:hypothetical protein n=1 Tax=Mesorhizobium sp. M0207 TaxID=2956915 RepID=UPI003337D06B
MPQDSEAPKKPRKRSAAASVIEMAGADGDRGKVQVIIRGRLHVCNLKPSGAIDLNSCVPVDGQSVLSLSLPSRGGEALPDLAALADRGLELTAAMDVPHVVPPALRQACFAVAQRTGQFRKQNQFVVAQLSSLDLDNTAQSFPPAVSEAMLSAERTRIALIRAFADFDGACASLETAARAIAQQA